MKKAIKTLALLFSAIAFISLSSCTTESLDEDQEFKNINSEMPPGATFEQLVHAFMD
ncbi:hypothetical protein [Seonamhaeicola marinus]|uniref:hypothetical protein n=1 Tax=Seonamhaeicola marinus TaxID=1912246 RepID=UPI0016520CBF|nr:hypothetical protein [Seonamhaeicola marinus]